MLIEYLGFGFSKGFYKIKQTFLWHIKFSPVSSTKNKIFWNSKKKFKNVYSMIIELKFQNFCTNFLNLELIILILNKVKFHIFEFLKEKQYFEFEMKFLFLKFLF